MFPVHPVQVKIFKAMSPARKLELAARFYWASRELKAQALKQQHPGWSQEQVEREVRRLFLHAAG